MIKTIRVSYAIGFSCSLDPKSTSAYMDIMKWNFSEINTLKLRRAFCRGYKSGMLISREVRYEFKMAIKN